VVGDQVQISKVSTKQEADRSTVDVTLKRLKTGQEPAKSMEAVVTSAADGQRRGVTMSIH